MAGAPLLDEAQVAAALRRLPAWTRVDPGAIERRLEFHDFGAAFAFVTRVALLAERANHHPDVDVRWNRVRLRLTTHAAGGLTERDVALAERVDAVAAGAGARPPPAP